MGDWANDALQTVFWNCANAMRREAKLCDIVLYVQNRRGFMVGHPAHKLLLISTSKYFKLLFEREDLRNYCHFPHLNEEGLICVLDIIYGREIAADACVDDALMAARFLQVEHAITILEKKHQQKERNVSSVARGGESGSAAKNRTRGGGKSPAEVAQVRLFKNLNTATTDVDAEDDNHSRKPGKRRKFTSSTTATTDNDNLSDQADTETNQSHDSSMVAIKTEPGVDLTADDSYQGYDEQLPQISFVTGGDTVIDGQNYGDDQGFDATNVNFDDQMMDSTDASFSQGTTPSKSPAFKQEGSGSAYNPYRAVYQKKPYLSWSSENMKQAIIAVRTKAMGLKQAGIRYGVPRTTLQRRCKAAGSPDVCSIKRTGVRKTIVDEFIEEAPNMDKMAALTESLSAE